MGEFVGRATSTQIIYKFHENLSHSAALQKVISLVLDNLEGLTLAVHFIARSWGQSAQSSADLGVFARLPPKTYSFLHPCQIEPT